MQRGARGNCPRCPPLNPALPIVLLCERHLHPHCPPFERAEGTVPPPCLHLPASLCILFYTHSLLVVVGYKATMWHCNEHTLIISTLQVRRQKRDTALNAKTEQFITAKISSNALKQGNRTHSMVRQRSSQLQKYTAARMSRRITVDQKVCGGDGGHQARNQLGTPGGTKNFLRGAHIF